LIYATTSYDLGVWAYTTQGDIVTISKHKQLKILIVDDHPIVLKALHSMFQDLGYMAEMAVIGEEAVVKAAYGYDLILIDIGLPGINGLEAVRAIRKIENEKPAYIIVLTAHVSEKIEKEAILVGANLVVPKPIKKSKIKEVLELCIQ
jgi:two-component system response regulator PhoP